MLCLLVTILENPSCKLRFSICNLRGRKGHIEQFNPIMAAWPKMSMSSGKSPRVSSEPRKPSKRPTVQPTHSLAMRVFKHWDMKNHYGHDEDYANLISGVVMGS